MTFFQAIYLAWPVVLVGVYGLEPFRSPSAICWMSWLSVFPLVLLEILK